MNTKCLSSAASLFIWHMWGIFDHMLSMHACVVIERVREKIFVVIKNNHQPACLQLTHRSHCHGNSLLQPLASHHHTRDDEFSWCTIQRKISVYVMNLSRHLLCVRSLSLLPPFVFKNVQTYVCNSKMAQIRSHYLAHAFV